MERRESRRGLGRIQRLLTYYLYSIVRQCYVFFGEHSAEEGVLEIEPRIDVDVFFPPIGLQRLLS